MKKGYGKIVGSLRGWCPKVRNNGAFLYSRMNYKLLVAGMMMVLIVAVFGAYFLQQQHLQQLFIQKPNFRVSFGKAKYTIYIRSDGSVEPATAPIQRDGDVYTFTDNIYDEIVAERDNVVVDGAGYTLQGRRAWYSKGIDLTGRSNVTIKNIEIKEFFFGIRLNLSSSNSISGNHITNNKVGIWLSESSDNSISRNNVRANHNYGIYLGYSSGNSVSETKITANNYYGIHLEHSSGNSIFGNIITKNGFKHIAHVGIHLFSSSNNNRISGNNITENDYGIFLWKSSRNTIFGNDITKNDYGILFTSSSNNIVYHNNFVDNTKQVYSYNSTNVWTPEKVEAPFWMQWWLWAIAAVAIAALAGTVYLLKRPQEFVSP